jgi:hypothetical protein
MTSVTAIFQGDTLFIDFVLYDENDELTDSSTAPTLELWKGNELVVSATEMEHLGIGSYRHRQHTSTLSVGTYNIVIRAQVGEDPVVETKTVEVTRPWQRSLSG